MMEMMMQRSLQLRTLEALISDAQPPVDVSRVRIRPLRPDDAAPLLAMHERLSAQTIYQRYLRPFTPRLEEMAAVCRLTGQQGAGFAAEVDAPQPQIVGMGYYVVDGKRPFVAEPAVLIEDRYQGMGLGSRLFNTLCIHAQEHGITAFTALVQAANRRMFNLLRRSGYPYQTRLDYAARDVWMPLQPVR